MTNKLALSIALSLLMPMLAFYPTDAASKDDWPMFHHDSAHSGLTNSSAPKTTPNVLWRVNFIGSPPNQPIIVNDVLYYSSNFLHAYNATTGEALWVGTDNTVAHGSPIVVDDKIFLQGSAFNAVNGYKLWNITTGLGFGSQVGVVAYSDGYLYTTGTAGLVCLDASTGILVWSSNHGSYSPSPAVANGYIYFNGGDSTGQDKVFALNAHTGSKLWEHNIAANYAFTSPSVDSNYVYVRDGRGIVCLNVTNGEECWNYALAVWPPDFYESSPAVAYGCVYVGDAEGTFYALNISTGEKIWSQKITSGKAIQSSPAIADGAIYVAADDGCLYCLNAFDGSVFWNYKLGEPQNLHYSPAIANDRIYIGFEEQALICLEQKTVDNRSTNLTLPIIVTAIITVCIIILLISKRVRHNLG